MKENLNRRSRRSLHEQNGAILVFLALGVLAIILGFASIMLNYDVGSYVRKAGQNSIDTAALSAVNTFCSSRACFDDALEVATDSLEETLPDALDIGSAVTLASNSGPEWTIGNLKVTIQRGRWWPDGVPSNIAAHVVTHANGNFEPIDLLDTTNGTWQQSYPGIPEHVVANALYMKIEYVYDHKILNIYGTASTPIVQETYAAAGQLQNTSVCAAPFALHVCALLNESGEYDKDVNCRFERHFTNANRYCPPSDPDCEILPGSIWTPAIDEDDYNFWGNLTPAGLPSTREHKYRSLCSWETYPRAFDVRDHYGLVGLPYDATIDGTVSEEKVLRVIDSPQVNSTVSGGCAPTKLGEQFVVLEDGLSNNLNIADVNSSYTGADDLVWSQIQDSTEGATFHPDFKDSMLKTGFPTIRQRDDLWARDSEDLTFHSSRLNCTSWPRTRYGHCNSKHLVVNNECRAGEAPGYWDETAFGGPTCDFFSAPWFYQMWEVTGCPHDGRASQFWYDDGAFGYWDHDAYFNTSLVSFAGSQGGRTLPVWKVPIPVIASMGDLQNNNPAASCDGVNENPGSPILHDPNFESDETYIVIGFIDAAFYDSDIGAAPPQRAEHDVCDSYGAGYGFIDGRDPHGFSIGGVPTPCNVVKGTSHCTNNVLSSVLAFQDQSTPAGRLYAAGVSH